MIKTSDSKEITSIYTRDEKEIIEVRDSQNSIVYSAIKEISGVPPLHFTSCWEKLLDYRIYGNTVQDGTPTPENPVEVQGVGEQTENLFDKDVAVVYNAYITRGGKWYYANDSRSIRIRVKPNTQYTLSTEGIYTIFRILEMQSDVVPTEQDDFPQMQSILIVFGENQSHYTFRTSENAKYIVFQSNLSVVNNWLNELMLVEGNSIRSDYIPYGYKIPVTVLHGTNSITTPVYIGNEPLHKIGDYADYVDYKRGVVVRRIKKLVLTGKENYDVASLTHYRISISITLRNSIILKNVLLVRASHYITNNSSENSAKFKDVYTIRHGENNILIWFFIPKSFFSGEISKENCAMQFKSYLAAQYAAGTPVTIWYVLAEPEEKPLENLLPIQTIKGTNILTADTTVQPSEMYIKYRR